MVGVRRGRGDGGCKEREGRGGEGGCKERRREEREGREVVMVKRGPHHSSTSW